MARIKIPIVDLRPTQLTLGMSEVTMRAAKIIKLSPDDREAYLDSKAIPHVIGPDKQIFMVDHHHLARALWSLDIHEAVLGDQFADWSDMEIKSFWRKMESNGYCWPIDADGNRRPYAAIPHHVGDLTDNVWRSLAQNCVERHSESRYAIPGVHLGRLFSHIHEPAADRIPIRTRRRSGDETRRLSEAQDLPGVSGLTVAEAHRVGLGLSTRQSAWSGVSRLGDALGVAIFVFLRLRIGEL